MKLSTYNNLLYTECFRHNPDYRSGMRKLRKLRRKADKKGVTLASLLQKRVDDRNWQASMAKVGQYCLYEYRQHALTYLLRNVGKRPLPGKSRVLAFEVVGVVRVLSLYLAPGKYSYPFQPGRIVQSVNGTLPVTYLAAPVETVSLTQVLENVRQVCREKKALEETEIFLEKGTSSFWDLVMRDWEQWALENKVYDHV